MSAGMCRYCSCRPHRYSLELESMSDQSKYIKILIVTTQEEFDRLPKPYGMGEKLMISIHVHV